MVQRHGAETKREESKLQAATMNFLSGIMGKTRRQNQKHIHSGRAQDEGNTESNQGK
jgi:hypothetical protein